LTFPVYRTCKRITLLHCISTTDNKEIFIENNAQVLFILSHSSDQLQPHGLLGFNLLKLSKNKTQIAFQENTSQQTKEIVGILNALEVASTSTLVIKAWKATGIFRKDVENFPLDGRKCITVSLC